MQRLLELLFGAEHTPVPAGAETAVDFNPPTWMGSDPRFVNVGLVLLAVLLVVLVYRRDGRRPGARVGLGVLRALLLAYVITLINRPVLRVTETRVEPSVVAILIDDSISQMVRDAGAAGGLALSPNERPAGGGAAPAAGATTNPSAPSTNPTTPAAGPATTDPAATRPAAALASAAGAPPSSTQPTTGATADAGGEPMEMIGGTGPSRLDVAVGLLAGDQQALIRKLAETHALRFYRFSRDASAIGNVPPPDPKADKNAPRQIALDPKLVDAIRNLRPEGGATQVVPSLLTVLGDLQGQRLAGLVLITDARETPAAASPAVVDRLKKYGAKIVAVPVGSESPLKNVAVTSLGVQDSAFKDDLVSVKVGVRAAGFEQGKTVRVRLKDKRTGQVLRADDGREAQATATFADDRPQEVEVVFQPKEVGTLDLVAEADAEEGELSARDNVAQESVAVLDAKINVLYVDGYPRWEYRYIKNEMIRDKTVNISCLLTSADPTFFQEADPPEPNNGPNHPETGSKFPGPVTRFPESAEELGKYDVVLFGDVDPRQFTDRQLQLLTNFVNTEAGGFGMISGPQHAPAKFRNTALEAVLPVQLANVGTDDSEAVIRDGWRPVVTDEGRRGEAAMMFRFFTDREKNDKYLREDLQPLFWFSRGVTAKSGVGLVYAEHPLATDPTGRKAPLLVLGRFGAGRTLFSAIDDSWRWRYYTGESVFDTYWVQQIRYLARGRKLAERGIKFTADREKYERGQSVKLSLSVLSPKLLGELPPQIKVDVVDEAGNLVRQEAMLRQETPDNLYTVSFPATDRFGTYRVRLAALSDTVGAQERAYQIIVPRLELERPEVDRANLLRLTSETNVVPPIEAREKLPTLLTSAAKTIPLMRTIPLWDNPLSVGPFRVDWIPHALVIFMLLITAEWVLRKVFGML